MDFFVAIMVVAFLWLLAGSACIAAWKHIFDDIESRKRRVAARFGMLLVWPIWLVVVAVVWITFVVFFIISELFK